MSARVTFTYKEPGDSRDGAWLTSFFTDLRTVTGALGDRNLREEGIRLRHFDKGVVAAGTVVPAQVLGISFASPGTTIVAQQAWGVFPGALAVNIAGPITLAPEEMLRVRARCQLVHTIIGPVPGLAEQSRAELRVAWTRDAAPENDGFSEVWEEFNNPGGGFTDVNNPILSTFGTYYNNTGADMTFTNITAQFQNNGGAVPADCRVDNVRVEADKFRRV